MKLNMQSVFPIICYRLTRACNIHCKFCFASKYHKELNTEMVKTSINRLRNCGMREIRIGGGEPTVRNDLLEIINFCLDLKLKVKLSSNLYEIDKIFPYLVQLPISITTSLHGNQNYHDYITGVDGSYIQTISNISKLIQKGKSINVHSTLTSENFMYVEELIQNLIKLGIKKVSFQTFIPRERGIHLKNTNYSHDIQKKLEQVQNFSIRYQPYIKVNTINLYQKFYYVFEPDGYLYLQQDIKENDIKVRRII